MSYQPGGDTPQEQLNWVQRLRENIPEPPKLTDKERLLRAKYLDWAEHPEEHAGEIAAFLLDLASQKRLLKAHAAPEPRARKRPPTSGAPRRSPMTSCWSASAAGKDGARRPRTKWASAGASQRGR
jgi:hypothetical protein